MKRFVGVMLVAVMLITLAACVDSQTERNPLPTWNMTTAEQTEVPRATEITDATEETDALRGKIALFFGDSVCAGTTVGENAPEYRYGWGGLVGEANDIDWKNYGRNGAVITDIEGQTRLLADQVDTAKSAYANADFVIFEGGCNDADQLKSDPQNLGKISEDFENFDTTTFTGAMEALILRIKTSYPDATLGYIIPPKMGIAPYDSEYNARRQYFDRAIEVCEKWGIPYLDLWNECDMNPSLSEHYDSALTAEEANAAGKYYTDGQHLTLRGYQKIAPLIEEFMRSL